MYQVDIAIGHRLVMQHPNQKQVDEAIVQMSREWDVHPGLILGRVRSVELDSPFPSDIQVVLSCPAFTSVDKSYDEDQKNNPTENLISGAYWTYFSHDPSFIRETLVAFNENWDIPVFYAQQEVDAQIIGVLTPADVLGGIPNGS